MHCCDQSRGSNCFVYTPLSCLLLVSGSAVSYARVTSVQGVPVSQLTHLLVKQAWVCKLGPGFDEFSGRYFQAQVGCGW